MDPARISTSCDKLLTELLDDAERVDMIRRMEEYVNTLNNRQGLGFAANGLMLDNKRIRNMIIAAFGIFSTVAPFIYALFAGSPVEPTVVYGKKDNCAGKIYAYSATPTTYSRAMSKCESLWMEPVSCRAITRVSRSGWAQRALPGKTTRRGATAPMEVQPEQAAHGLCDHFEVDSTHTAVAHRIGGEGAMKWKGTPESSEFGVFCQAKSLYALKAAGTTPVVVMRFGGPCSQVVFKQLLADESTDNGSSAKFGCSEETIEEVRRR